METNTRATDRARERMRHLDQHGRFSELRLLRRDIVIPALDFADAVEAALSMRGGSHPADSLVEKATRKALTAFLAQLDRATGGAA